MLSGDRIKTILSLGEIEISVSFYKENDEIKIFDKEEKPLLEYQNANQLYSDRVKLTMGPVIKPINQGRIRKKEQFKNTTNCIDIRKCNNCYTIQPGESVIILTNERIQLNGKYSCLVIPRISLSDVGIVVTPAYIDPYYNGILRLQLSNLSNKPYELIALEAIAQCFFFELSDEVSKDFRYNFSTKSVFFGQTWSAILNSDRNPFPTKKESLSPNRFSNILSDLKKLWEFAKKHSLIFILLTNFIALATGYVVFSQDYNHVKETVTQMESWLNPSTSEITIPPNSLYGEKVITLDVPKADIISILCNVDDIRFEIKSGGTVAETQIIFSYTAATLSNTEREITFSYVIVRRNK